MEFLTRASSALIAVALIAVCLILPLLLTAGNLYNLFVKTPFREELVDRCTFFLGPLLMCFLWSIWSAPDWDTALWTNMEPYFHSPLASWHLPTILAVSLWVLISFWSLYLFPQRLPPLPTLLCIAGLETGCVLSLLFLLQLSPHLAEMVVFPFDCLFMALFPLNYLLVLPRLLRRVIQLQMARLETAPPESPGPFLRLCRRLLAKSLEWLLAGFLLALPILAVLLGLLVLLGQAPDAAVRAFTETSDWALSQMIPPPPVEYHGHYLCTVAAEGHPRLVNPLRKGLRHGWPILVNRQLCIANAFEQLLQERMPRLHKAVRGFYDAHGYPLSQKITTPLRADAVYLLMKPLEWFFLLFLYSFDTKPENRIAMQYTGR